MLKKAVGVGMTRRIGCQQFGMRTSNPALVVREESARPSAQTCNRGPLANQTLCALRPTSKEAREEWQDSTGENGMHDECCCG